MRIMSPSRRFHSLICSTDTPARAAIELSASPCFTITVGASASTRDGASAARHSSAIPSDAEHPDPVYRNSRFAAKKPRKTQDVALLLRPDNLIRMRGAHGSLPLWIACTSVVDGVPVELFTHRTATSTPDLHATRSLSGHGEVAMRRSHYWSDYQRRVSPPDAPPRSSGLEPRSRLVTASRGSSRAVARATACGSGLRPADGRPSEWIGCERISRRRRRDQPAVARLRGLGARAEDASPVDPARRRGGRVRRGRSDGLGDGGPLLRRRSPGSKPALRRRRQPPALPLRPRHRRRRFASCRLARFARAAPARRCSIARAGLRGLVHAGGPPYFAFGLMTLLPQPVERDDG